MLPVLWTYIRGNPVDGVLHYSDPGSQYAAKEYQEKLKKYKMLGSMGPMEAATTMPASNHSIASLNASAFS